MRTLVTGYEYYTVSPDGIIRTVPRVITKSNGVRYTQIERIVKPIFNKRIGRHMVQLRRSNGTKKTITVARLIAIALNPNPNNYRDVNHINGIKTDDAPKNLEWCSHADNCKHKEILGLGNHSSGENHYYYKHGQSGTKEYQRIWHRVTNRGYDWNALTQDQRLEIGNSPKLSGNGGHN